MLKIINFFVAILIVNCLFGQCYTNQVPVINSNGGSCYNDFLAINGIPYSSSSGYQSAGNSYQYFNTPYINFEQGGTYTFEVSGVNSSFYNLAVWIDFNNDSIFDATDLAYLADNSTYTYTSFQVNIPNNASLDTIKVRLIKLENAGGWGFANNDACNIISSGEIEEYNAIVSCPLTSSLSYDPYPAICYDTTIYLWANSSIGNVAWYSDTTLAPFYFGDNLFLNISPTTIDTTLWVQSTNGTCFIGPKYQMYVQILPNPQVNILSADTVQSCGPATFNASPGFDSYYWYTDYGYNEGFDPFITINNGGGYLNLMATTGMCSTTDKVWISVASDSLRHFVHMYKSPNFCSDHTFNLYYDSIFAPGTCNWYLMPSNTLIGSGSNIQYITPTVGNYYVDARIQSVCGLDTAHLVLDYLPNPTYDSLTFPYGHLNNSGVYEVCYNESNLILTIAGLNGINYSWNGSPDGLNWYFLNNGSDTLFIPSTMVSPGLNTYVFAQITNSNGCIFNTDTLIFTPINTQIINFPDNYAMCNFPANYGITPANYSQYDYLWNTGDTTSTIFINTEGTYTLTIHDNLSGCNNYDHVTIADGSHYSLLPQTTYSCTSQPYFVNDFAISWTEYDDSWYYINSQSTLDYMINYQGFNEYLVLEANYNGCNITDTTYVDFSGNFTFSLGNDTTVYSPSYTLNAPSDFQNGMYPLTWMPGYVHTTSYTVTASGQYTLTIDNLQGCTYTDTINVTLQPNYIKENNFHNVICYPNPATSNINISSDSKINSISLTDLYGRKIIEKKIDSLKNYNLNISEVNAGCYFINIVSENNKTIQKIIIQK